MLFNDNEAACAFQAASRVDPSCSVAFMGATLAMGPNVNHAFIASSELYRLILESLNSARVALGSLEPQAELADELYAASVLPAVEVWRVRSGLGRLRLVELDAASIKAD